MKFRTTIRASLAALFLMCGSIGCVGGIEGSESDYLVSAPFHDIVGYDVWGDALMGCDGMLDELDPHEIMFARAEGAPDLGVLMHEGEAICVDTWDGLEDEAARLNLRLEIFKGDPSPDPMRPVR